jgi:subtilisin family serine protease
MTEAGKGNRTFKAGFIRIAGSVAVMALLLSLAPANAQSLGMRGPNINVRPSISTGPNINVGPRISVNPSIRTSPNVRYDGYDRPRPRPRLRIIEEIDDGPPDAGPPPRRSARKSTAASAAARTYVAKEVLIELEGNPGDAQADALARRYRLTRLQSQAFPLTNSTFVRWRINDGRSVDAVVRELSAGGNVKSAQRNNIFRLQQSAAAPVAAKAEGDPVQYALGKLRLPEAHALSVGADVTVAVIDSGIDAAHPELAGTIAGSFDALNSKDGPHAHGTGIAGVIAAHGRLLGTAPSARLLAIRAFGAQGSSAEGTTLTVLRSLDYAVADNARVINMSFAGPRDAAMERGLAAVAAKGILLVAAAGNAGAKSPPLYPAADRNVIAVTATDQSDKLFPAANRGRHIAVAAPGVDILSAAPEGRYQMASGTSLAAAYVSGLAALMISRRPDISAADIREALTATARDLGPKGHDDEFGAGEVDAFAAVSAVAPAPLATASDGASKP